MVFQVAGVLILLAFYGCYFGKMVVQRRRGITTNQMGKGKTGAARVIERVLMLATYLAPLAEVVGVLLGTSALPTPLRWVGVILGAAGVAVFALSVVTMRDSWRAGVSETERTELITGGVYQISRNPAFLGFDLVYAGLLMMFFHGWLLAVSAFAMAMLHLQIVKVEEAFLVKAFGDDYLAYQQKVCRYLGRKP